MVRQLAENLWVVERPLRFGGVALGTRMSIVRLDDGSLFLYSPVALDDALRGELLRLGTPRYAVAPNRFHHLFVGEYRRAFPEVQLYAAPGLPEKRRDLSFDAVLPEGAPPAWADQLEQEFFQGLPAMNEVVFCHRPSRTLLVCDLAFNLGPEAPLATRFAFRLIGGYGRLGPSLLERVLTRDRTAARGSLERILRWDFDRVVVTHGTVLESGGREALQAGYRWLLEG
ncbi:MAG: DUF4336 domain-containing protein [Polyangiaceae bacterium]|jgi:hypothetical protein|nr:DUF4336 domain-containing protein [Polyangiaceae bacterium]